MTTGLIITNGPKIERSCPELVVYSRRIFGVDGEDIADDNDGGVERLQLHDDHVLDDLHQVAFKFLCQTTR